MCSPRAAEHTGPGDHPKGTDQSIQGAFHQKPDIIVGDGRRVLKMSQSIGLLWTS